MKDVESARRHYCEKLGFEPEKALGLKQFTVEDLDGNRFFFHCD